jgi:hypothetical protein
VNNWKVIFATVVIFGAGVITGGLLVNYVQHPHFRSQHAKFPSVSETHPATNSITNNPTTHPPDNSKLRPPEILSKQFLQQLDGTLHLTADQRETIQKIIGESQNQIRKVVQDGRLEIREVLTPDQQKQFDELVKRPFRHPIYGTNAPATLPVPTNSAAASTNVP